MLHLHCVTTYSQGLRSSAQASACHSLDVDEVSVPSNPGPGSQDVELSSTAGASICNIYITYV